MSRLSVTIDGYTYEVELDQVNTGELPMTVWIDGRSYPMITPDLTASLSEMGWFIVANRPYEVMIDPDLEWIRSSWGIHSLEIQDLETSMARQPAGDGRIKAPIPGQITQVIAAVGEEVAHGQPLLVLEAMKMENEIRAPRPGRLKDLRVSVGQRVALHEVLAEID